MIFELVCVFFFGAPIRAHEAAKDSPKKWKLPQDRFLMVSYVYDTYIYIYILYIIYIELYIYILYI